MSKNLFKRASVAVATIAASASLFAGPDMDTRLQHLETQMKQVRTETAAGTFGARTAVARPEVDGSGAYLTIEALLWHGKIGGTEYAYTDNDSSAAFPLQGRTRESDFGWTWGFRVGLGYNFDHDGWDAYLNYTYWHSADGSKVNVGGNGSVIPLLGNADLTTADFGTPFTHTTFASAQFKFHYDNLDLELGRNYFVSRSLSFRPHFGIRNSWLNLTQVVQYCGGSIIGQNTFQVRNDNDFWGIGPRAGVNSKWHLTDGFSIFGDVSGSLLWGYYEVCHEEEVTNSRNNRIRITANMHRFAPNVQLALGLAYDKYIYNDKQHIGISLGWENLYYWRVNQALRIDDFASSKYERVSEDLSMHGMTLKVRWDF